MDEKVSLVEVCRRWETLLERKRQSDELVRPDEEALAASGTSLFPRSHQRKRPRVLYDSQQRRVPRTHHNDDDDDDSERDPYDCSDCAVPPSDVLVAQAVERALRAWEALEERKVPEGEAAALRQNMTAEVSETVNDDANDTFTCIAPSTTAPAASTTTTTTTTTTTNASARATASTDNGSQPKQSLPPPALKKKPKWFTRRVRLPENFDYANKNDAPPPDDGTGDRVLVLDSFPPQTTSYHAALWNLFRQYVPTRAALDAQALDGLDSPAMTALRAEWLDKDKKNQLYDKLAFTRLRMSSQHAPVEVPYAPPTTTTTTTDSRHPSGGVRGTLVWELWRGHVHNHLSRMASPTEDRCVLEFRGDQTLADMHRAICELSLDTFWDRVVVPGNREASAAVSAAAAPHEKDASTTNDNSNMTTNQSSEAATATAPRNGRTAAQGNTTMTTAETPGAVATASTTATSGKDTGSQTTAQEVQDAAAANDTDKIPDSSSAPNLLAPTILADAPITMSERSGVFLLEDTLYTFGPVDYAKPILEWFKTPSSRATFTLGYSVDELIVRPMAETRLDEIPLRLGVRYLHIHSGNVQSQVFLIDRRHGDVRVPASAHNYPIVHDMWGTGWPSVDCEACLSRGSSHVTITSCEIADGCRMLCAACRDLLQVPPEECLPNELYKLSGT